MTPAHGSGWSLGSARCDYICIRDLANIARLTGLGKNRQGTASAAQSVLRWRVASPYQ